MPMDRALYPSNWEEISYQIRFVRAAGFCERCGVAHGDYYYKDPATDERLRVPDWARQPVSVILEDGKILPKCWLVWPYPITQIVLTTAHLGVPFADGTPGDKSNKLDCRPENLLALCQACHLAEDMTEHIANRRQNQKSALKMLGQQILAGMEQENGQGPYTNSATNGGESAGGNRGRQSGNRRSDTPANRAVGLRSVGNNQSNGVQPPNPNGGAGRGRGTSPSRNSGQANRTKQ